MAAPAKEKQYKIEDLYNVDKEEKLLKLYVDVALQPHDKTWKKHKTKNPAIKVDYKFLPNDNLCTIRGETVIKNCTIDDYYNFTESGFNDVYEWEKSCDPMCNENYAVKCIDIDHDIVYGSYDSGLFVISPRDFCYVKARRKVINYPGKDGKLYDVSCTLCYSIDDSHPFFIKTKKKHVRGILKYSGYIFVKCLDDPTSCRVFYIVYLDPAGWIPTWVVNLVAPDQGMVIKTMLQLWPKAVEYMNKRKDNNYKKDNQMMFDSPQKQKQTIKNDNDNDDNQLNDDQTPDDDNKSAANDNDDVADKIIGGWKEIDTDEMKEVLDNIKDKLEGQAKDVKQDDFTVYEGVSGTKQVVAGTNYKIKIKLGDDIFCDVEVFRSLPPFTYNLKRATW